MALKYLFENFFLCLYYNITMPKKGQIIINPKTSRPIKIGSRTWLSLVKEGILEGTYDDPNELYTYDEGADYEQVENKRKELNLSLPKGQHAVKGRGKYKNKLVIRKKRLKPADVEEYTRRSAVQVVKNNLTELNDLENLTDAEIEEKLSELLGRELLKERPKRNTRKPKAVMTETYEEIENDNENYEDEFDDGDELYEDDDVEYY